VAQLNKPLVAVAILAGVALVAIVGLKVIGPTITPAARRPLVKLDAARMPAFEAQFDAASDSTRLLVLLSPT
jgi:hypothetical protein